METQRKCWELASEHRASSGHTAEKREMELATPTSAWRVERLGVGAAIGLGQVEAAKCLLWTDDALGLAVELVIRADAGSHGLLLSPLRAVVETFVTSDRLVRLLSHEKTKCSFQSGAFGVLNRPRVNSRHRGGQCPGLCGALPLESQCSNSPKLQAALSDAGTIDVVGSVDTKTGNGVQTTPTISLKLEKSKLSPIGWARSEATFVSHSRTDRITRSALLRMALKSPASYWGE